MPTTRKRAATAAVATLGVLLSGAISGCSISKDEEPAKREPATAQEPTPTPTEEPSETPSATPSPTASASASAAPAGTPEASLLGATELPQLNETSRWTERRTTVPGPTSFGLCQQFDTLSAGAMSVVERSFTTGTSGKDTAGQQVAEFPDAQNTVRASKVLEAWHRECTRHARGRNVKVRAITDVPVANGKGWWYLVSYTRGGAGYFHSFGVVFSGNRMTLLKMDHEGQDHNYEPGQDPMELAVMAASTKMA
jgi:hypothetical protein